MKFNIEVTMDNGDNLKAELNGTDKEVNAVLDQFMKRVHEYGQNGFSGETDDKASKG